MKKTILIILTIILLCNLCGCSSPSQSNNTSTPSTTHPSETPGTEASSVPSDIGASSTPSAPMVSVALPVITLPGKADDGTVIFNYTYQEISMTLNDPEVADEIILDFMNRIDSSRTVADSIYTIAKNEYTGDRDWNPYLCLITYDPMRLDQSTFSLFGNYATYQGSTHPETEYLSINYDLISGNVLSLSDILTDQATADALYDLTLDALSPKSEEYYLFDDYQDLLKSHFGPSYLRNADWYFSSDGLCLYFQPYEIAPYASGPVIAEIPYEKLWGILKEDYFPTETDTAIGQVFGETFSDINVAEFTKYVELILDDQADNILLYTDDSVQNIRIEIGEWSASGAYFTPQHTVFAASSLSKNEALLIEANLTNILPVLHLHYDAGGNTETYFITKDEHGKIILTR